MFIAIFAISKKTFTMKQLIFLTAFFFMATAAFAQWNESTDVHHGCSHAKTQQHKGADAIFYYQSDLLWDYDVKFYFLDIEVDPNTIDIAGNVTIHAEVAATSMDTLALEYTDGMVVDSAFVDGVMVSTLHTNNHIFMELPASLSQGDNFIVQVFYHGTPPTGGFFSGVSNG